MHVLDCRVCTYVHAYIRACIDHHTYIHACIHTCMQGLASHKIKKKDTQALCTYTHKHTYIHTYMHTCIHTGEMAVWRSLCFAAGSAVPRLMAVPPYIHTYIHT